jgi:hypothetical protein
MASLIVKWQKCGKNGCRCTEGFPHGPYFWYLKYISKKSSDKRKGKYSWTYLGKNPIDAWKKVCSFDKRFKERYKRSDLNKKIDSLMATKIKNKTQKMTEQILTVEEPFLNQ